MYCISDPFSKRNPEATSVADDWDTSTRSDSSMYGNLPGGMTLTETDWRTPSKSTINLTANWMQPMTNVAISPPGVFSLGYWGARGITTSGIGSNFTGMNFGAQQSPYMGYQAMQKQTPRDDLQPVDMDVSDDEDGKATGGLKWSSNPVRSLKYFIKMQ